MGYIYLGLATISQLIGSSLLTASEGMKKKKYAAIGMFLFALAYVIFSRAILTINLSIAYAIFCGAGIILASLVSLIIFKQKITKVGMGCMMLILVACVIIHLFGSM